MVKRLICVAVQLLRFIYLFFKPLPLRNQVTIISRQSDEPTLDIRLLEECLNKNGIKTRVLTKALKKTFTGVIAYCFQMLQQMYYIATSKVIVIDGYCILVSVLPKKNQKVIQMWHALGAIKKFGWQNTDSPDGHSRSLSETMNMHKNYDYVLAPGALTGKFFSEAFDVPEEKVVYYGLPRIDFIRSGNENIPRRIEESYPKIKDKKNVLYVPTFRKNAELDLKTLVSGFDFTEFNLIIKKHFLDKGDYSWAERSGAIIDNCYSSMEWLQICEKVITDYSAIAFEAAILDRELYIYQPDVSDYTNNVGLNIDLSKEAIGEYVCKSEKALFDKLKEPYRKEAVITFCKKYIEIDIENCTQKLTVFIKTQLVE